VEAILALNAGSSSVKFAVYEARTRKPLLLFRGLLDRHTGDTEFIVKDAAGNRYRVTG
jgi:acetate kinase